MCPFLLGHYILVLNQPEQAETALLKALLIEAQNQDFFIALVACYLKSGQSEKAKNLAIDIVSQFPDHNAARELLEHLGR